MRASGRPALLAALLAAAASLAACAYFTVREDAAPVRSYTVPGFGALELDVPQDWRDSVEAAEGGLKAQAITFQPPSGYAFRVRVVAFGNHSGLPDFNSPDRIRRAVERQGTGLLPSAMQKTLAVETLQGPVAQGFYYTLTDKIAVEHPTTTGDYPYLTQGAAGVGDLLVSFSIYFRDPGAPEREAALAMIAGARHVASPKSSPVPGAPTR
jgi:hypothetical protein